MNPETILAMAQISDLRRELSHPMTGHRLESNRLRRQANRARRIGLAGRIGPFGPATIETYSVRYDWPVRTGVIIGRLNADGSRFMALTEDDDLVGLMSDGDPLGAHIVVTSTEQCNRARLA